MYKVLLKYAPVQVVGSLSAFLLIVIQTRLISAEIYGVFSIFLLTSDVVKMFCCQWVTISLLRLYPGESFENKALLEGLGFKLVALFYFLSILLVYFVLSYCGFFSLENYALLLIMALVSSLYLYFIEIARLRESVTAYRRSIIAQSFSIIGLNILILPRYPFLETVLILQIVSYLIGGWGVYKRFDLRCEWDFGRVKQIVLYGWPLILSGVLTTANSRIDRLFLAEFVGIHEAGIYSAFSNSILGIMMLTFTVISLPLYPSLSKCVGDPDSLKQRHSQYFDILIMLCFPALIGLIFISESFVFVFFGSEFHELGGGIFSLIAISVFLLNIRAHFFDHGLQFSLATKYLPVVTLVGMMCNILLFLVQAGRFGVYAAAYSSICANLIAIVFSYIFARKAGFCFGFGENKLKTIGCTAVMALGLAYVSNLFSDQSHHFRLLLMCAVGIVVYFVSHVLLNSFGLRDRIFCFKS